MLKKLRTVWIFLYFLILAIVFTWPLVLHMGSAMVGEVGDNIYFVWMIGWMKRALFELHVNPFDVWFLNYPEGWNMAYTEITPAMLLLALPFSFINETFAYNAALLLAFILSGIGMYAWVKQLSGRTDAALLAGTAFAALPYRMAHFLIGHLNLSGTFGLPFYFMGLFQILRIGEESEARFRWKPVLLTGVSLGVIGLTSQYYLYMAILISAVIVVIYLLFYRRDLLRKPVFWKSLAAAGLVALPLVALAVAPYVTLNSAGGLPDRNLGVVRMYSASPTDFLLPSTDHFLFGRWIGANFNRDLWIEGTLYVGVITLALFVLAFVRRKSAAGGKIVSLLGWGALAGLILAMGTDLHWNGAPVILTTPDFLKGLIGRDDIPLVLPGYFLFKYFPFYAKLRAFMRFGVFVLVFVCAGAGIGSAWLVERARKERRLALAVLLTGLIIFDFYPGPYQNFAPVQARPVDSWLAQQPGDGALVQFPFIKGEDQDQTYNTLVHGKPFVGGFFNAFPPAQYTRVKPVMERFPDEESVSLMRTLGVQWVLVDVDEYEDIGAIRQESQDLGLQYIDQIGDEMVFELKP